MRTLFFLCLLVGAVSAFSLLREFDDERLLFPNYNNRVRRFAHDAASSSEETAVIADAEGSGISSVIEGSGQRAVRDTNANEQDISGEFNKYRLRRNVDSVQGSGEEGSGEETPKESVLSQVRRRREAKPEIVEASGEEGSGQA